MDTTDHSEKSETEQSDKELDDGLQLDYLFEETNINTSPTPVNNKTEEVKINISPGTKNNKTKNGPCPSHVDNGNSHVDNGNSENKKHGDTLANLHATLTRPRPSRTTRGREVRPPGYLTDYVV